MLRPGFLAAAMLAVAACLPVEPQPGKPGESDACGASRFQGLVNQPATVLRNLTLPDPHRVIGYGEAITTDYSPARLNIELGQNKRIARIACY